MKRFWRNLTIEDVLFGLFLAAVFTGWTIIAVLEFNQNTKFL